MWQMEVQHWWSKESTIRKRKLFQKKFIILRKSGVLLHLYDKGNRTRGPSGSVQKGELSHGAHGTRKIEFPYKSSLRRLPTPVNLHVWVLIISDRCKVCGKTDSLKHSQWIRVCSKKLHVETKRSPWNFCLGCKVMLRDSQWISK